MQTNKNAVDMLITLILMLVSWLKITFGLFESLQTSLLIFLCSRLP